VLPKENTLTTLKRPRSIRYRFDPKKRLKIY
jgi:hypothetical protein